VEWIFFYFFHHICPLAAVGFYSCFVEVPTIMDDGDPAAPPAAELVARLPKGVSADEFTEAAPAVQGLILARATVISADDLAVIQLPPPPADVCVSLPKGVTIGDYASASTQVRHIIKAASSVTKKRERSEDVGHMVAHSAAHLQNRLLSGGGPDSDVFQDGMVAAVCHESVRKQALAAKQPARSVGFLPPPVLRCGSAGRFS
jgi:hypothetical protein